MFIILLLQSALNKVKNLKLLKKDILIFFCWL